MNWAEIFDWPGFTGEIQTIPKQAFLIQDRITSAEKKILQGKEVQSISLLHALKRSNSNVPEYENDVESYREIFFIQIVILESVYEKYYKPVSRLVHKLLPHHCLIITRADDHSCQHISLYTKTIHPHQPDVRVLGEKTMTEGCIDSSSPLWEVLSFAETDNLDLRNLYSYYQRAIQNYNLISLTGSFRLRCEEQTGELLLLQSNIREAESRIRSLRTQLKKETQMRERVRINTEIYHWKTQTEEWKKMMKNILAEES